MIVAGSRDAASTRRKLAFSIDATPDPALCEDPGRVTLRRLNRTEYDNTVRDLLGTDAAVPPLDFPADDFGYGFDTIGDVLALSPLLFEKAESGGARARRRGAARLSAGERAARRRPRAATARVRRRQRQLLAPLERVRALDAT